MHGNGCAKESGRIVEGCTLPVVELGAILAVVRYSAWQQHGVSCKSGSQKVYQKVGRFHKSVRVFHKSVSSACLSHKSVPEECLTTVSLDSVQQLSEKSVDSVLQTYKSVSQVCLTRRVCL